MQERAININSFNRQKIGRSRPEVYTIKFDPIMHLDTEMRHELAVDRVTMTYSWHNINAEYGNNQIKYTKNNGSTWKTINFVDGMYSYDDISEYIGNDWQLDIRNSTFSDLIGFEPKIITQTEYSTKLPNITNSIDTIHINCDVVTDSITDGKFSNTLAIIPTDNLTKSYHLHSNQDVRYSVQFQKR